MVRETQIYKKKKTRHWYTIITDTFASYNKTYVVLPSYFNTSVLITCV